MVSQFRVKPDDSNVKLNKNGKVCLKWHNKPIVPLIFRHKQKWKCCVRAKPTKLHRQRSKSCKNHHTGGQGAKNYQEIELKSKQVRRGLYNVRQFSGLVHGKQITFEYKIEDENKLIKPE